MLAHGADTEAKTDTGDTALLAAAKRGFTDLMLPLLRYGADPNPRCAPLLGWTPLMFAASAGANRTALLLAFKAEVNARDDVGYTPLMIAADYGNGDSLRLLLEHLADVNAQATNGRTALMLAAAAGHAEMVRTLLAHGADRRMRDADGQTAATLAAGPDAAAIKRLLRE